MKNLYSLAIVIGLTVAASSCQDKDYDIAAPKIAPISAEAISGSLNGDDYVWTWTAGSELDMQVSVYNGSTLTMAETVDGNTFVHHNIDTNIEYTYVFKLTSAPTCQQVRSRTTPVQAHRR